MYLYIYILLQAKSMAGKKVKCATPMCVRNAVLLSQRHPKKLRGTKSLILSIFSGTKKNEFLTHPLTDSDQNSSTVVFVPNTLDSHTR